jgi:Putative bacterial sensory transduction regulator
VRRFWFVALVLAFLPTIALAQDIPTGGLTMDEVITWLQSQNYSTQIVPDTDGTNHVRIFYRGLKLGVYRYDCSGDRCGSLQFSAGWAMHGRFDVSRMNEWNRNKRWCRGYFDRENDPWVEEDVDLTPGGTYELLNDSFATFRHCVDDFTSMYGIK